jgi:hypothetical protein
MKGFGNKHKDWECLIFKEKEKKRKEKKRKEKKRKNHYLLNNKPIAHEGGVRAGWLVQFSCHLHTSSTKSWNTH